MTTDISTICKNKEAELLETYFGDTATARNLSGDNPEAIGGYTSDLPLQIESEYRQFLVLLWKNYSPQELVLEEQALRRLMTESDRECLAEAMTDATTVTLWERLTRSNYRDVARYKSLLYRYTKQLLDVMRLDFLEEVTSGNIENKEFEE